MDGPGPQRAPRPEFDLGEVRLGPNLSAAPAPWPRTEPPALAPAHDSDRLVPEPGALRRDGVEYRKTSVNADTWVNGPYVIKKTDQGYLWTGLRGRFRHYDADGRLTAEGGRLGVNRSWKRDADGRVTHVLDSANRTLAELKYAGESVSITDRAGNVSKIVYKSGQVERIVTPQGETGFAYVRDRLASVAYPSGLVVSYACDDYGYLRLEKDNAGLHRVFDYNYDFTRKLFYSSIRNYQIGRASCRERV